MRTYSSPWEAAEAGVRTVSISEAVLDQVLRGNYYVYAEIQALQDQDLTVGLLSDQEDEGGDVNPELVDLRRTVSAHMDLKRLRFSPNAPGPTAIWRLPFEQGERSVGEAEEVACYQPDILITPPTRPLQTAEAERQARRVGALQ